MLHRASRDAFCGVVQLRAAGFRALSSRDDFGQTTADLRCPAAPQTGSCPNIPAIPLRIGRQRAVAQVDTGYDARPQAPSHNINKALLERIQASGLRLRRQPAADLPLSSCVPGQQQMVRAYQLADGGSVELVGSDGQPVRRLRGVTLYLKHSPPAIQRCGGIGTWQNPAALLGASFVNDGTLVVDPFSQRLWFRGPLERGPGG